MPFHCLSLCAALLMLLGSGGLAGEPPAEPSIAQLLLARGYTAVPMSVSQTRHLEISAEINGQPVVLIVDSGSPTSVLDRSRGARLKLSILKRNLNAAGVGGSKVATELAELKEVKIGNLLIRNLGTAIIDLSVVNAGTEEGKEADGILGADVLAGTKAVIDYSSMTLFLQVRK